MLAPGSILEPEPLGLCQQCSHNLIHDSFSGSTSAATVSLLLAAASVAVSGRTTSRASERKASRKRETIGRQRNVTNARFPVRRHAAALLFSLLLLLFVLHSLLYCRSPQLLLMLIYAAWLAQHQQGGVLSLDYQQ